MTIEPEAPKPIPVIEPTPEEKRNGWTAEALTRYLNKRMGETARFALRLKRHKVLRVENHHGFSPFDW